MTAKAARDIFEVLTRICEERFGHKIANASRGFGVKEAAEEYGSVSLGNVGSRIGSHEALYALALEELPTSKTTTALLYSLKCLLPPERYLVFQHELKQLETEFKEGHFTACALRVGRSLELIVYGAARSWEVRLDEQMFSLIGDLQRRLQLLNAAIIDYRSADAQSRVERKAVVQRLGADLASQMNSLGFLLDDEQLRVDAVPPRNIEAILRDIRKTFGRFEVVRNEVKEIIEKGLIRAILEVRNDAAHSDLDGGAREVSERAVIDMLENVQLVVHKLSLIGETLVSREQTAIKV
jgi:hypothetical protein